MICIGVIRQSQDQFMGSDFQSATVIREQPSVCMSHYARDGSVQYLTNLRANNKLAHPCMLAEVGLRDSFGDEVQNSMRA